MGLVNNFFLCMTEGIPMVMLNPVDFVKKPALWLRSLVDTGATVTWSPNFGFAITAQRVRDSELQGVRLDGVRGFYNAAERIHYETLQAFHKRFAPYGLRYEALKTNFGCAENVGGATFSDPDGAMLVERIDRDTMLHRRIARPVTGDGDGSQALNVVGVGRPHPDMSITILSRVGRPLPDGHVGEIGLETPSRMSGYMKDARATRRAIYGKYLRTGDLGYMRDGEVFWVGRVRERITVRGVKLDPSDFEPILLQISDLRSGCFAAFGVDDEAMGTQRIVIVTEVRDAARRPAQEISSEIRSQVFDQLGINVNDVLLVRQGTLTKTSSGKRRHKHFRQHYLNGKLQEFTWTPDPVQK
jgi:acyl-CoA synthetase (AMP-forming)/AMP-acid ligase II